MNKKVKAKEDQLKDIKSEIVDLKNDIEEFGAYDIRTFAANEDLWEKEEELEKVQAELDKIKNG